MQMSRLSSSAKLTVERSHGLKLGADLTVIFLPFSCRFAAKLLRVEQIDGSRWRGAGGRGLICKSVGEMDIWTSAAFAFQWGSFDGDR